MKFKKYKRSLLFEWKYKNVYCVGIIFSVQFPHLVSKMDVFFFLSFPSFRLSNFCLWWLQPNNGPNNMLQTMNQQLIGQIHPNLLVIFNLFPSNAGNSMTLSIFWTMK